MGATILNQDLILLSAWVLFIGMILSGFFFRIMHLRGTRKLRKEKKNWKDRYEELREKHVEMHFELKYIFHIIEAQCGRKLSDDRDKRMTEIRDLLPDYGPEITIN